MGNISQTPFVPAPWILSVGEPSGFSAATLTANKAYFVPVILYAQATLTGFRVSFGTGGAGNYDVGIYDASGNLLTNKGAIATATGIQSPALASSLSLSPGRYYLGFWINNATDTILQRSNTTNTVLAQNVTATSNLPSSTSGAVNIGISLYLVGLFQGGWS